MLAIIELARTAFNPTRELEPRIYLKADGEILFMLVIICGIITSMAGPVDYFENNMIRRMMGYNNLCVVWDVAPAKYFAATVYPFLVYCSIRYSMLACSRLHLTRIAQPRLVMVSTAVNLLYPLSEALVSNIFVVTPVDGTLWHMQLHMAFFLQLVPTRFIVVLVNYWDASTVTWSSFAFLVVYGICTAAYATGGISTMVLYKNDGVQIYSPAMMNVLDWTWFACLPLTTFFLPDAPVLKIETALEVSHVIQMKPIPLNLDRDIL